MTTLFISDLHLDAGEPETIRRFANFIDQDALAARELYILGDLFEAWVGDDDDDPRLEPVVAALARQQIGLDSRAQRHDLVGVDVGERFAAEELCHVTPHERHAVRESLEAAAVHEVGLVGEERREHGRHVGGVVLQVGVELDDEVRSLGPCAGEPRARRDLDYKWPGPQEIAYKAWQPKEPSPIVAWFKEQVLKRRAAEEAN